jgi:hypothetical protein
VSIEQNLLNEIIHNPEKLGEMLRDHYEKVGYLEVQVAQLKNEMDKLGVRTGVCTRDIIGRICSDCDCGAAELLGGGA